MLQLALLLSSCCLSLRASAIFCFNDGARISNYTAQRCLSTLTFINIPLVPPGATDFTPPPPTPPMENLLLLLFKTPILIETKPALFLAYTLQEKANIGGSLLPSPWRQSPSPTTVSSLGASPTPSRERDIYDSDGSDGSFTDRETSKPSWN